MERCWRRNEELDTSLLKEDGLWMPTTTFDLQREGERERVGRYKGGGDKGLQVVSLSRTIYMVLRLESPQFI